MYHTGNYNPCAHTIMELFFELSALSGVPDLHQIKNKVESVFLNGHNLQLEIKIYE